MLDVNACWSSRDGVLTSCHVACDSHPPANFGAAERASSTTHRRAVVHHPSTVHSGDDGK
jgi:hypothetical protein